MLSMVILSMFGGLGLHPDSVWSAVVEAIASAASLGHGFMHSMDVWGATIDG